MEWSYKPCVTIQLPHLIQIYPIIKISKVMDFTATFTKFKNVV